jgi:hypothetical protein
MPEGRFTVGVITRGHGRAFLADWNKDADAPKHTIRNERALR